MHLRQMTRKVQVRLTVPVPGSVEWKRLYKPLAVKTLMEQSRYNFAVLKAKAAKKNPPCL
jgi:hypothetical protein